VTVQKGNITGGLTSPIAVLLGLALTSCSTPSMETTSVTRTTQTTETTAIAPTHGLSRYNGRVSPTTPSAAGPAIRQIGSATPAEPGAAAGRLPAPQTDEEGGITLNYIDTDIREIIRQILGNILKVNYTIVSGFQGQVTIQTTHPLTREELLPTLQDLVSQSGGTMIYQNGFFRIGPAGDDTVLPPVVDSASSGMGSQAVPLRYASAKQLAATLQPFIGEGAKLLADPGRNVLVVSGSLSARRSLVDLIRVFDVDYLAGQSYALFPVKSGDPKKVATDLQHAIGIDADGPLAGTLNIIPIEQANAIMVVASRPAYLERASRLIGQIDRLSDSAGRNLHVYYLKNVQAQDIQSVLQRAVNPPSGGAGAGEAAPGNLPPTAESAQTASTTGAVGGGLNPGGASSPLGGQQPSGGFGGIGGTQPNGATNGAQGGGTETAQAEPDLGQQPTGAAANGPQIIADTKSNTLIIVATEAEYAKIEAAIRRLDVTPMQVLIDVTVAEVTLNDTLQYGTQFFLHTGSTQATLTTAASSSSSTGTTTSTANEQQFPGTLAGLAPGFSIARTASSIQFALEALKSVTTVKVISSPKLLIMDRQTAKLQVGDLVPTITQSATSVVTANSAIVNSVEYQQTGVILAVTPKINSGGLVTLDINQQVSQVVNTTTSSIDSPTFQQRQVSSKVIAQDGETISLAGMIQDSKTDGNSGIPWLSDIPYLGHLFSTQTNNDVRTELLILITPHVIYDQHDARALTEELRVKLARPSAISDE
jgi:general secretion pathway protein D